MDDWFDLPVNYQGRQKEYKARLLQFGYLHKVEVLIDGISVLFEPDEERNYRALVSMEQVEKSKQLEPGLLQVIASQLQILPEA